MSMFEVNNEVPDFKLPKPGKYSATLVKVENTQSSKGNAMLKVELVIPAGNEELTAQGITWPVKVFDNIIDAPAEGCQRKKNSFLKATKVASAEDLQNLIGKSVDIRTKIEHSEGYDDKVTVSAYVQDSLKDVVDVPF